VVPCCGPARHKGMQDRCQGGGVCATCERLGSKGKSFLLLFFKKEGLPCFLTSALPGFVCVS
jgi:hypothetical protein